MSNTNEIFEEIVEKIQNTARFWDLFKLSLPGRIAVIKTLMLPQLNYLGCILEPSAIHLDRMHEIIESFALRNLRIAANRLYLPVTKGGLGLIRVSTFLDAQKIAWIKRAHLKCIDNWRTDLTCLSPQGDVTKIRICDVDKSLHPVLHTIVSAYSKLLLPHGVQNGNYKKAFLFENPCFTWGDEKLPINRNLFGQTCYDNSRDKIRDLRLIDCFNGNTFKSREEFLQMGINMNQISWDNLRGGLLKSKKNNLKRNQKEENKCQTMDEFFKSFKKGSKKYGNCSKAKQSINRTQLLFRQ